MKWLFFPLLWIAAAVVALAVLWRLSRGRNIVLCDRFSPKFIRMVAVVLVFLGAGVDEASADRSGRRLPAETSRLSSSNQGDTVSDVLDKHTVVVWRHFSAPLSSWMQTKQSLMEIEILASDPDEKAQAQLNNALRHLPNEFREIVTSQAEAIKKGQPKPTVPAQKISKALTQLESKGRYDNWAMAYLWRTTALLPENRAEEEVLALYTAFNRHARVVNTLIRAESHVKPPVFRPWRSKAAPPSAYRLHEESYVQSLLESAHRIYPHADSGTWQNEATVVFAIDKESVPVTLVREGKSLPLVSGKTVRMNRLDLLKTPQGEKTIILEHSWLGAIELPAGRILTVWDLPGLLSANASEKITKATASALEGDEQAIERIECALPLCHNAIRVALKENPKASGAPRLRTILATFDY